MSHPAYDPSAEHPDVDSAETQYVIHSSLTTTLHRERGLNTYDAFGKWTRRHGLTGRIMAGEKQAEPFEHLELALEVDATSERQLHEVHVVAKRALETEQIGPVAGPGAGL